MIGGGLDVALAINALLKEDDLVMVCKSFKIRIDKHIDENKEHIESEEQEKLVNNLTKLKAESDQLI